MNTYICRWPNGDLSLVAARDRQHAVIRLDEAGDATEAELFETENLLVDFALSDRGHLEFEKFGERLYGEVMEQAYPLILKARLEDEDETEDYTDAARAERERIGQTLIDETDLLTRNIAIARVAANENISLEDATTKYKIELPITTQEWSDLAAKVSLDNRQALGFNGTNLRTLMIPFDIPDVEDGDLLPHYLFAAVLAEDMGASLLTTWDQVKKSKDDPIGNFWQWMANEVKALPNGDSISN